MSPHLDDGVMSCGELLAACPGSRVVTVFTGSRPAGVPPTEWDRASGFGPSVDAVAARRAEDAAALELLGASPVWLGVVESQYGVSTGVEEVADRLADALSVGEGPVAMPMGLWHDEHRLVHEAALLVMAAAPGRRWAAYADALYRNYDDGVHLRNRHEALERVGIARYPLPATASRLTLQRKIGAVASYGSQLRALCTPGRPGVLDAFEPEQYWELRTANPCRSGRRSP